MILRDNAEAIEATLRTILGDAPFVLVAVNSPEPGEAGAGMEMISNLNYAGLAMMFEQALKRAQERAAQVH